MENSIHLGSKNIRENAVKKIINFDFYSYSKIEGLKPGSAEMQEFDYLLISASDYQYYTETHDILHKETGYSHLSLSIRRFPPSISVTLTDKIFIIQRKGVKT